MRSPRIGVAIGREAHGGRRFDTTPHEYVVAIIEAGGIPLLVPPLPAALAGEAVGNLDGMLLTGGGDVSPARYGSRAEPETKDVDEDRDASEVALIDAALARGVPVLGVCRGAQMLNVAFGGTLHQDLVSADGPTHLQGLRRFETVHHVDLLPDSLLASRIGQARIEVNSIHHQGVNQVGTSLTAVGFADDGLVEVLESRENKLLAVQWHPECLPGETASRALFTWLVEEARGTSELQPG